MQRRKMVPRGLRPPFTDGTEVMPEHAKMAQYVDKNWAIWEFLAYLADRDINLTYITGSIVKVIQPHTLEALLMRYRGVDPDAYAKESEQLSATYGALLAKHARSPGSGEYEQLALIDEVADDRVIRIIKVLDELGLPAGAGRPTCAQAMYDASMPVPKTSTLARAVKFRKMLYEAAVQNAGHFTADDPRNRHNLAASKAVSDGDKEAINALMAKLKGKDDAAQD